jgi:hypothetical protein
MDRPLQRRHDVGVGERPLDEATGIDTVDGGTNNRVEVLAEPAFG